MNAKLFKRRNRVLVCLVIGIAALFVIIIVFANSRFNIFPQIIASTTTTNQKVEFPMVDEAELNPAQIKVMTILRTEYELQPEGIKYSEGVNEAWCADFVSWVFKEAEVPLSNPNSGYWRIPGTYTLREYYEQNDRFKAADSDYSPKIGDIMLYDNPSPFGQHTNIVIDTTDGVVTTIGGNEPGGIRIVKHTTPDSVGFIGYGVFTF